MKTLSFRELAAGMAEFIKMAAMFDDSILDFIEKIDEKSFLNATCENEILLKL